MRRMPCERRRRASCLGPSQTGGREPHKPPQPAPRPHRPWHGQPRAWTAPPSRRQPVSPRFHSQRCIRRNRRWGLSHLLLRHGGDLAVRGGGLGHRGRHPHRQRRAQEWVLDNRRRPGLDEGVHLVVDNLEMAQQRGGRARSTTRRRRRRGRGPASSAGEVGIKVWVVWNAPNQATAASRRRKGGHHRRRRCRRGSPRRPPQGTYG
eukprot:70244-Chlamydomonas_euryale.AAC.2